MPTSLGEWAGLDVDPARRRGGAEVECDLKEALGLRVLWEVRMKSVLCVALFDDECNYMGTWERGVL